MSVRMLRLGILVTHLFALAAFADVPLDNSDDETPEICGASVTGAARKSPGSTAIHHLLPDDGRWDIDLTQILQRSSRKTIGLQRTEELTKAIYEIHQGAVETPPRDVDRKYKFATKMDWVTSLANANDDGALIASASMSDQTYEKLKRKKKAEVEVNARLYSRRIDTDFAIFVEDAVSCFGNSNHYWHGSFEESFEAKETLRKFIDYSILNHLSAPDLTPKARLARALKILALMGDKDRQDSASMIDGYYIHAHHIAIFALWCLYRLPLMEREYYLESSLTLVQAEDFVWKKSDNADPAKLRDAVLDQTFSDLMYRYQTPPPKLAEILLQKPVTYRRAGDLFLSSLEKALVNKSPGLHHDFLQIYCAILSVEWQVNTGAKDTPNRHALVTLAKERNERANRFLSEFFEADITRLDDPVVDQVMEKNEAFRQWVENYASR